MKKIFTITFHHAKNYGAVLQCYALQHFLKKQGYHSETIDFRTEQMQYRIIPKPNSIKSLVRCIASIKNYKKTKAKYVKYDRFVEESITLTKHYSSINELRSNPPDADIIITGSDQVFNPTRRQDERQAYYLDFPCRKRASFSASFGSSVIAEDRLDEIRNYLDKFDFLSVREQYAVDTVKNLCKGIEVFHTIDPVFLLDAEDWVTIEEQYIGIPDRYILYFSLRESKSVIKIAKELKNKTGLPVVAIIGKPYAPKFIDYVLRDAGPQNYLWLVRNCEYFIEDSFHATAFSLIFHKKFMFADDHPASYERGRALLDLVGLSDRYDYTSGCDNIIKEVDYERVDNILLARKSNSEEYLKMIIDSGDDI